MLESTLAIRTCDLSLSTVEKKIAKLKSFVDASPRGVLSALWRMPSHAGSEAGEESMAQFFDTNFENASSSDAHLNRGGQVGVIAIAFTVVIGFICMFIWMVKSALDDNSDGEEWRQRSPVSLADAPQRPRSRNSSPGLAAIAEGSPAEIRLLQEDIVRHNSYSSLTSLATQSPDSSPRTTRRVRLVSGSDAFTR